MSKYFVYLDGRERISKAHMRGYRVCMTFEHATGADILITPLDEKISNDTIQAHLEAGMVMVQVKHGMDFPSSVIDQRLTESLLRMSVYKAQAYQCGLLLTGDFKNVRGQLYVNGQRSHLSWKGYEGALRSWNIRGGVVWPIIQPEELQEFVDGLGNKLFAGSDPFLQVAAPKPRKKFRPQKTFSKGMTLRQKARLVKEGPSATDLRHLLINISGLTQNTVTGIWELMKAEKMPLNITSFVQLVVDGRLSEVKGIGPKTQELVKEQIGYGPKDF